MDEEVDESLRGSEMKEAKKKKMKEERQKREGAVDLRRKERKNLLG